MFVVGLVMVLVVLLLANNKSTQDAIEERDWAILVFGSMLLVGLVLMLTSVLLLLWRLMP